VIGTLTRNGYAVMITYLATLGAAWPTSSRGHELVAHFGFKVRKAEPITGSQELARPHSPPGEPAYPTGTVLGYDLNFL
jgi:hypothetical protein